MLVSPANCVQEGGNYRVGTVIGEVSDYPDFLDDGSGAKSRDK
jgi:hypothetical protein